MRGAWAAVTNGSWRIALVRFAFVACALVAVSALVQTALLVWGVSKLARVSDGLPETLEQFVDEQIDAGYADPELRADDPLLAARKILLHHTVNARTAKDVVSRLIALDRLDGERPIDLYISTQGGWIDSAFTIIDAIELIDAPVNTWAVGGCYSAGALILAAGTGRRYASGDAIIMVHTNLDDSSDEYSFDRLARERYESVWRRTAKLPEGWFPMTSENSYYLSADDALRFGIVDEVASRWPSNR